MELESTRGWTRRGYDVTFAGKIDGVDEIRILTVSVIDQVEPTFTCEIEFEANLRLYLHVDVDGRDHGAGGYEPGSSFTTHKSIWHYFCAEVIAHFDPKDPADIQFESVHVYGNSVELRDDQVVEQLIS
jgi:hypothetical protein